MRGATLPVGRERAHPRSVVEHHLRRLPRARRAHDRSRSSVSRGSSPGDDRNNVDRGRGERNQDADDRDRSRPCRCVARRVQRQRAPRDVTTPPGGRCGGHADGLDRPGVLRAVDRTGVSRRRAARGGSRRPGARGSGTGPPPCPSWCAKASRTWSGRSTSRAAVGSPRRRCAKPCGSRLACVIRAQRSPTVSIRSRSVSGARDFWRRVRP